MVISFKIGLVVLIQYGRVTDRHPASHVALASTALASVAQVKTKIRTVDVRILGFLKTLKTARFVTISCQGKQLETSLLAARGAMVHVFASSVPSTR